MEKPKLTVQQIINKVREIANRLPDYVYQKPTYSARCQYKPDMYNPHGCIFGYALRELGESIDSFQGKVISGVLCDLEDAGKLDGKIWVGPERNEVMQEIRWCDRVQAYQDGRLGSSMDPPRLSWEDCVKKADKEVKLPA